MDQIFIVHVYLQDNPNDEVLFWSHFLAKKHRSILDEMAPMFLKNQASAHWIRKTR